MVEATLEKINAEILKYQNLTVDVGDTRIIKSSKEEKIKVTSDEMMFEEENVYMYLTFNPNVKKVICVFYLTKIDEEFVDMMISKVGLLTTEQNIRNYGKDPSLIDAYWNKKFIIKYKEIMRYLRKTKVKYQFQERFKPTMNKNRFNEIVYE
jgi:hypothetical protein